VAGDDLPGDLRDPHEPTLHLVLWLSADSAATGE
jgi:hypothetical protein